MLIRFGIEIGKVLARCVLMLSKVIVGTVGDTPEFAPSEGEEELEIGRRL